jgi:hypothetical protein
VITTSFSKSKKNAEARISSKGTLRLAPFKSGKSSGKQRKRQRYGFFAINSGITAGGKDRYLQMGMVFCRGVTSSLHGRIDSAVGSFVAGGAAAARLRAVPG